MNGIDKAIIERSEELVLLCAQSQDIVAACANLSEGEEEDLKQAVRGLSTWPCCSRSLIIRKRSREGS